MSKTILIFPGQGSQAIGMGRAFAEGFAPAAALLEGANQVLGMDLRRLMFEGPEEELRRTQNTQPALFVVSMMGMEFLRSQNRGFDFVAGHSLGEYSALCAAGAFTFEAGLGLVRHRGLIMAQAAARHPGAMSAILGLEEQKLAGVLAEAGAAGVVVAANFNTPVQVVISGETAGVARAEELAKAAGAKRCVRLPVSGAFHSPLMAEAAESLREKLAGVEMRDIQVPLLCNVLAEPVQSAVEIRELLVRQLTSPVRWTEVVRRAVTLGCTQAVEVGAGKVLAGLVKNIDRNLTTTSLEAPGDIA